MASPLVTADDGEVLLPARACAQKSRVVSIELPAAATLKNSSTPPGIVVSALSDVALAAPLDARSGAAELPRIAARLHDSRASSENACRTQGCKGQFDFLGKTKAQIYEAVGTRGPLVVQKGLIHHTEQSAGAALGSSELDQVQPKVSQFVGMTIMF